VVRPRRRGVADATGGRRPIPRAARHWAALAVLAAAAALAAPAAAFEIVVAAGLDGLRGPGAAAAAVEARSDALRAWRRGALLFRAAVETDGDGDLWGGAGPVLFPPLGAIWRVEASVMLGAYRDGGGNDLGAGVPIFRSMLGLSRALAPGWRLGASISHKSNAGTAARNPGVETLLVGVTRSF